MLNYIGLYFRSVSPKPEQLRLFWLFLQAFGELTEKTRSTAILTLSLVLKHCLVYNQAVDYADHVRNSRRRSLWLLYGAGKELA